MSVSPAKLKIGLALLAVYVIWGTTYLGIRFAIEGFPPMVMNGIRFLIAGPLLLAIGRWRKQAWPSRAHWASGAKTGVLLLVGGVGLVSIAEFLGVGSGVAATAVAVIPLWTALISGLFGDWPTRREWLGLAFGLGGVLVLVGEGDFQSTVAGTVLIIVAPVLWSLGSVWSARIELAAGPAMATASQLLPGGVALLAVGLIRGERIVGTPGATSWWALLYLISFGSVIGYTAYVFLLRNASPAVATSYAFVNPGVAVFAGMTLGSEVVTGHVFIALPLILVGVGLVTLGRHRTPMPEPVLAVEDAI